jgi:hypothetical protein
MVKFRGLYGQGKRRSSSKSFDNSARQINEVRGGVTKILELWLRIQPSI